MMFQYEFFVGPGLKGKTIYDYFRHGNDGLVWDCVQIIGLHEGKDEDLNLSEKSPVWTCQINGKKLELDNMDRAYMWAVDQWFINPKSQDPYRIVAIHEKTASLAKSGKYV